MTYSLSAECDFERPLEIVQHRQQRPHRLHGGVFEHFAALAFHAFFEILKFGLSPQDTILEFGLFAGQPIQFLLKFAWIGLLRFGCRLITHIFKSFVAGRKWRSEVA